MRIENITDAECLIRGIRLHENTIKVLRNSNSLKVKFVIEGCEDTAFLSIGKGNAVFKSMVNLALEEEEKELEELKTKLEKL